MSYFLWELKVFFMNKKNLLLLFILFIASLYYAFYIAPHYESIEKVDQTSIEARYNDRAEFLETVTITEDSHAMTLYAVAVFPEWNEYDLQRLEGLENNDLQSYASATSKWYAYSDAIIFPGKSELLRYNRSYYTFGNRFAHEDGHYAYQTNAIKYEKYANAEYDLTLDVFNERTALQTLERLSKNALPYVLLIMCLILCNDIVTRDRHHQSIVSGFPKTPFQRLLLKGAAALCAMLISYLVFVPAFMIIGFINGFGSLSLPVVIYDFAFLNLGDYSAITMGAFLAKMLLLIVMWNIIIIGFILLLSVLFKNEFLNLLIVLIFFTEKLYYQRGGYFGDELALLPTSYVQIGNTVTGYLNYYLAIESVSYVKGIISLGILILVIVLLISIVARFKKKLV